MSGESNPRFDWGQRVQAAKDMFNDGTYPEQPENALLVREGEAGEIVQVGKHLDSGAIVSMVEFATDQVVGCFEPELMSRELGGLAR